MDPVRTKRAKTYDRAYFDRWYRGNGIGGAASVRRAVRYALSAAELFLERPVRRALDVGCGEAVWRAPLLAERPRLEYVGVDASEYSVSRYGRTRGVRLGQLGALDTVGLRGRFDLVICADVLHYLDEEEIARGIAWIAGRLDGAAYLHAMTAADGFVGDRAGFRRRGAGDYLRLFAAHGLHRIGPHLYVGESLLPTLTALEAVVAEIGERRAPALLGNDSGGEDE